MSSTKEIISQYTINFVQYTEYRLINETPESTGEYKTELNIKLLKKTCPPETLLAQWIDSNPTRSIILFNRVSFEFGFSIKPIDEMGSYLPVENYKFEMDKIEYLELLEIVFITCESYDAKVNLILSLDKMTNLSRIRIVGCEFKTGIILKDRNGLIIEVENCDIYDKIEAAETREKMKQSMYVMISDCVLKDISFISVNKVFYYSMKSCILESAYVTGKEERVMGELSAPALLFQNVDQCVIENLNIKNIRNGLEFNKIREVRIVGFSGKQVSLLDEDRVNVVLYIHHCDNVIVGNSSTSGILTESCKDVTIGNITVLQSLIQKAKYAVKVSACTGKVSVSDIHCEMNTVKNYIVISNCIDDESVISICGCRFEGLNNALLIKSVGSMLNIVDCKFYKMLDKCFDIQLCEGAIKFIDCQFKDNPKLGLAKEVSNLDFIGCDIVGINKGNLSNDKLFLDIALCNSIRFVKSFLSNMTSLIRESGTLQVKESTFIHSYFNTNTCLNILFENSNIDVLQNTEMTGFKLSIGDKLEIKNTLFTKDTPNIESFGLITLDKSKFQKGIQVYLSGLYSGSYIKECEFGFEESPKLFTKGIILDSSSSINIRKNKFHTDTSNKPTIMELVACKFLIIENDNEFANRCVIKLTNGEINNNHIILDSNNPNIPVISGGSNNFSYMLYLYNRNKYNEQYSGINAYDTIGEVVDLKLNTISKLDFNEPWVKPFIKKINSELNTAFKNIS